MFFANIFSVRFPPDTACLTLYTSNRGHKKSGLIPVCTFFSFQLCVATRRRLFPMQSVLLNEGEKRTAVILY